MGLAVVLNTVFIANKILTWTFLLLLEVLEQIHAHGALQDGGIYVLREDWMAKVDVKDAYVLYTFSPEEGQSAPQKENGLISSSVYHSVLVCTPWVFTKTLKQIAALPRQLHLGVWLIVHIDNILILAESRELARDHTMGLVYLPENLGFVIRQAKCQLEPMHTIGFLVNSLKQELSLPSGKVKKIQCKSWYTSATWRWARVDQEAVPVTGQASGSNQGGAPRTTIFLQTSAFAEMQTRTIGPGLPDHLRREMEELQWWLDHLTARNGKTIVTEKPSVIIKLDG